MTDLYADASALAKLVVEEAETGSLIATLGRQRAVSSALVRVELTRAVRVRNPDEGVEPLREILAWLDLVPVNEDVLGLAAELADEPLRSLDAIHLASALTVGAERMIVYDRRLAEAAARNGIEVVAPGR